MPVRKFRSVEEMNKPLWRCAGDPALFRAIAGLWDMGRRTSSRRFPVGVQKHPSIESLDLAQQRQADATFAGDLDRVNIADTAPKDPWVS